MIAWLADQRRTFWRNASTVRDFRSQMRGWKAILAWLGYVLILVIVATVMYQATSSQSSTLTIGEAQSSLSNFATFFTGVLNGLILLIAPAMIANSICVEYDRKSIDLIQSAPVSPNYFLIGKVLSAYRNIWMLLILALPISAMSVVLGGATWQEVLEGYFLLSLQGILAMAVAIPIAMATKKTITAVLGTYLMLGFIGALLATGSSGVLLATGRYGPSTEIAPFLTAIAPFVFINKIHTVTMFGTTTVSNTLLGALCMGWIMQLCLSGAAATLAGAHAKEMYWYRAQSLLGCLFVGCLFLWICSIVIPLAAVGGGISSGVTPTQALLEAYSTGIMIVLCVAAAGFVPYVLAAERKRFADRMFDLKEVFGGRPAGSLMYGWLVILCLFVPAATYPVMWRDGFLPACFAWCLATWFVIWAVCWFSAGRGGVGAFVTRQAQVFLVVLLFVPMACTGFLTSLAMGRGSTQNITDLHPLYLMGDSLLQILIKTAVLVAIGGVLTWRAELKRVRLSQELLAAGWSL